jgi:regulator of sigma E protease
MTILYSVVIFSILIFVHELGHFGVAKATGIKVKEFALGMGPAFFKKTKGETQYSLRLFPIGGFCAMEGEDEDSEDERAFNNKPFFVKAGVLVAGSAMNLLLAILILSSIVLYFGTPTTTLEKISAGSPAEVAGILAGDKVTSINKIKINAWEDVSSAINSGGSEPVNVEIIRNGEIISKDITPIEEDGRMIIGVTPTFQKNPISAVKYGALATWDMGGKMIDVIGQLFTGEVSTKELMGPVGIVNAVGDSAKYGFAYVAQLAALISLNLAIVNMLPLPALDGGRILLLIARKFTGKVITDEIEGKIHLIGFALLIGLMVYVTYQDVLRIF